MRIELLRISVPGAGQGADLLAVIADHVGAAGVQVPLGCVRHFSQVKGAGVNHEILRAPGPSREHHRAFSYREIPALDGVAEDGLHLPGQLHAESRRLPANPP